MMIYDFLDSTTPGDAFSDARRVHEVIGVRAIEGQANCRPSRICP